MKVNTILIPCDFVERSFNAVRYGASIAGQTGAEILLLHLVFQDGNQESAETNMISWKERLASEFNGKIRTLVQAGDIFEDIGKISAEKKCDLVIMPTHGMTGTQQITGSLALNVVTASNTPFLIVQEKPWPENGFKKIVIPVEYRYQLLEGAELFRDIAKHFNSEVWLVSNSRAEDANNRDVLSKFKGILTDSGVAVHVHALNKFDFSCGVAEFAASIAADLICSVNFSYESLYSINPRTDEEDLVYNKAQIPVLLITPKDQDDDLMKPVADM